VPKFKKGNQQCDNKSNDEDVEYSGDAAECQFLIRAIDILLYIILMYKNMCVYRIVEHASMHTLAKQKQKETISIFLKFWLDRDNKSAWKVTN